ncbi:MAG: UDP-3-O-(3-hydroxymyristoyl)glucosamine N-acyltransferase [Synergistaceae bacterium]|jgi:UDP-3-O-[3-hydroxymyristoyl] glucosamine N-acyltransferase|nr:UDP-3-O-(3-hydroxymyristoyl)glucosamine N-acyltransferase [Synergistaceae bacterium]
MSFITLAEVAAITRGRLIGDGDRVICGVCSPELPRDDMICVVWENKVLPGIPASVPVLSGVGAISGRDGIEMERPKEALIALLPRFDMRRNEPLGISPRAFVHESGTIGAGVAIGPGCVISEGVVIGSGVVLQANVYVGHGVEIGDGSHISALVTLHDFTKIGKRVRLHSGVVVGDEGFGYIQDGEGQRVKIPQIGAVIIEDDVEVGANSTIDRATFGATRIGRGTKIGSLTHIAHNCDIGEDCIVVGFVAVGGSARIGDGSVVAGQAGIADHVTIGRGVTIAGRSGVTKVIKDGLVVSGFPAREHAEETKFQASLRRVPELLERTKRLERRMDGINGKSEEDKA